MKTATIIILLLNSLNGFIFGLSIKNTWIVVTIGNAIVYIFLCGGLSHILEINEAKKRMLTNPITSFDQKTLITVSLFGLFVLAIPFIYLGMR